MDVMNFVRRLSTGLFGVGIGGLGLTMLGFAAQRRPVTWLVDLSPHTLAWSGGSAALGGMALVWLSLSRYELLSRRIVISHTPSSSVSGSTHVALSPSTVEGMLHYVTLDHEFIRGCKSQVRLENGSWQVHCDLWVIPSASIPEMSREVETEIRQALMHHTGIPVGNLDFDIEITSKG